jgi:hypothetical protein
MAATGILNPLLLTVAFLAMLPTAALGASSKAAPLDAGRGESPNDTQTQRGTNFLVQSNRAAPVSLSSNQFGFNCNGVADNSAALLNGLARALTVGAPFHIEADISGGTNCKFTSMTTINSPGGNALGSPPSMLIYIDNGVTILFNGSTGWLKISGLFGGTNNFRRSGIIGGNISADPAQSAGGGWALQLFNVNEAVVSDVSFFNYLAGSPRQPSRGLLLHEVFAGDVTSNFFLNHEISIQLEATSNFIKICGNEFGGAAQAVYSPNGQPNNANIICNNYFEQNLVHISLGSREADYQIYANYLNQGGCIFPCASPIGADADMILNGSRGQIYENNIVNSGNTDSIELLGNQISLKNNLGANNVGVTSGGHAIHVTTSANYSLIDGNDFNSPIQTGGLLLDQGTDSKVGANILNGTEEIHSTTSRP